MAKGGQKSHIRYSCQNMIHDPWLKSGIMECTTLKQGLLLLRSYTSISANVAALSSQKSL